MLQYYTSYSKSKDQWYKVLINFHVFQWMIDLIANSILALKSTRMSYVSWNKIKRSLRKNVPWIQELILTKKKTRILSTKSFGWIWCMLNENSVSCIYPTQDYKTFDRQGINR